MSIKWRNGRPVVEIYDPATKRKEHVKPRDHGMEPLPPDASEHKLRRWAEKLERAALNARDARRPGHSDETCGSFTKRWPDDYRRGRKGRFPFRQHDGAQPRAGAGLRQRARGPAAALDREARSARVGERASGDGASGPGDVQRRHGGRTRRRQPFARLGLDQNTGREDITVLTRKEVDGSRFRAADARRAFRVRVRGDDPVGGVHVHATRRGFAARSRCSTATHMTSVASSTRRWAARQSRSTTAPGSSTSQSRRSRRSSASPGASRTI